MRSLLTSLLLLRDRRRAAAPANPTTVPARPARPLRAVQHTVTRRALERGDSTHTLWLEYVARGGVADEASFEAYLHGCLIFSRLELLILEQTLWELDTFGPQPHRFGPTELPPSFGRG
ncbi:MAG TPA: hypothetical protein VHO01_12485 [Jatrophihabitans sp.]|nr:hypothetical protein [Jatrophihabitans sp.]